MDTMTTIYDDKNYKITVSEKPTKTAVDLLHSTLWGTKGPLFQHMDTPEKVDYLSSAIAFNLEKDGKAIGTCTVLERKITVQGKEYKTWYGRYFTIDKKFQGRIYGNLLLKHIKKYMENISPVPSIFYAYVEQSNIRSSKLLKYTGFEAVRNFETSVFSRMYPKKDKRVSKIKDGDAQLIIDLLKTEYINNTFVNFDNLFFQDNYFVLKENNEIIAGLQASLVKWEVRQLPGAAGKVIINILPHLPFVSKLFNPKDFRFAAFEGVFCKPGRESELFKLMESVCAELNLSIGMLWMDPSTEVYKRFKKAGDWGIMNKMREDMPVYVFAGFKDVPKTEQEIFYKKPAYISAFDLT